RHPEAEFIVFCGVHFMAESADVLSAPHQQVILPDLAAGCSMADMAESDQLEMCWSDLEQMLGSDLRARAASAGPHPAGILPGTSLHFSAAVQGVLRQRGGGVLPPCHPA